MSDWSATGLSSAESGLRFLQKRKLLVYRHAITPEARHALAFGILGGLLTGIAGQLPTQTLLRAALSKPFSDGDFIRLLFAEIALMVFGLAVTICALGLLWKAPSPRSRLLTGAGPGALFALAIHLALVGGVTGILANRSAFPMLLGPLDDASLNQMRLHAVYATVAEGYGMAVASLLGLTALGAALGRLIVPLDPDAASGDGVTRDAFGAFLTMTLPPLFCAMTVTNMAIYSLLDTSLRNGLEKTHEQYSAPLSILVIAFALPMTGQLLAQLFSIVWVWRSDVLLLHRSMLRFAQIVYGIGATFGQVILIALINPTFLRLPIGFLLISCAVFLALVFVMIAQRQLHEGRGYQESAILEIGAWNVWAAAAGAIVIGVLLTDMLCARVMMNLAAVNTGLYAMTQPQAGYTLNALLNNTLVQPMITLAIALTAVVIVSFVPLAIISWLVSRAERRAVGVH